MRGEEESGHEASSTELQLESPFLCRGSSKWTQLQGPTDVAETALRGEYVNTYNIKRKTVRKRSRHAKLSAQKVRLKHGITQPNMPEWSMELRCM